MSSGKFTKISYVFVLLKSYFTSVFILKERASLVEIYPFVPPVIFLEHTDINHI
jgi:hypothetical protein